MTEAEARAWLRAGPPVRRCVSYRADDRDSIVFARSRAALLFGPWLALLVACAGHLDARVDADPFACRDALGFEIECPSPADDWRSVPDEDAASPGSTKRARAPSSGAGSDEDPRGVVSRPVLEDDPTSSGSSAATDGRKKARRGGGVVRRRVAAGASTHDTT